MDQKLKQTLGELLFMNIVLQQQIEDLNNKIKQLENVKDA